MRGGAQKFEIDVSRSSWGNRSISDVVELDLSFQMRIRSSPKASGPGFYGGVLDFAVSVIQTRPSPQVQRWDTPEVMHFCVQESTLPPVALARRFPAKTSSGGFWG